MKNAITLELRKQIEELINQGHTVRKISQLLNVHESTIYRDIKRCGGKYDAQKAHETSLHGYHPIDLDIIGKKFGKLTILEYTNQIVNHRTYWKCSCECGNITYISRKKLGDYCSEDRTFSCGCIAKESNGSNGPVPIEEAALRKYQDLLSFREIEGTCWIWKGFSRIKIDRSPIPMTSWKNRTMTVRKCMYLLMNGTTYEPNHVHAACRNILCFNPEHIVIGRPPNRDWYR